MKRVVINGPTGAIGIALINQCIKQNIEVLALCRRGSKRISKIPVSDLVKIAECSLDELNEYASEIKYDVFYHFAWEGTFGDSRNDMFLQNLNIKYTLDAVDLAKRLGCSTFIGAGSQAEYGRVEGKLSADTPVFPENGYGIAKLCAGQMSRVMCGKLGIKHIWVRILSVYGPNDGEHTLVMSTIRKLMKGEVPKFTKGEQIWDFLYSGDAAEALLLMAEKGTHGKLYSLGSGVGKPLCEFINVIRDTINPSASVAFGAIPYSENQVMYLVADIDELKKDTGFTPKTEFSAGIRQIVDSLRSESVK